jgi:hypothetical protein
MTTPDETTIGFDEVLAQLMAADPDSFYRQAQAYDDAVAVLEETKAALAAQRRALEEMWSATDPARLDRLNELTRYLELLIGRLQDPSYPVVLRRIAEVIRDSQQRLQSLLDGHGQHVIDAAAQADRDKRARKILADLSGAYRQLGGSLRALPERTATGDPLPASTRVESSGGARAVAATPVSARVAGGSVEMVGVASGGRAGALGSIPSRTKLAGDTAAPSAPAPFGRFAQFAAGPTSPASGPAAASFSGFAGMAEPGAPAVPTAFAQPGSGSSRTRRQAPQEQKNTTGSAPSSGPGETSARQVGGLPIPARLDAAPGAGLPVPVESVVVPSQAPAALVAAPATSAVASTPELPAPEVSLAGSAAQVVASPSPVPTPNVPVVTQPLPPGPPPAAVATNASPAPLVMSANANLGVGASTAGSAMPPGLMATSAAGAAGAPAVRRTEVWLRAEASGWCGADPTPARLGRRGSDEREDGRQDRGCATEEGR